MKLRKSDRCSSCFIFEYSAKHHFYKQQTPYMLGSFSSVIFYKEDNFCDFLFAFMHTKPSSMNGDCSKRKHLHPREKLSFLLELTYFEGRQNNFDTVSSFASVYKFPFKVYNHLVVWFINMSMPFTKTYLCSCDPLKPHFYIVHVKLGFTGVNIIFSYFCAKTYRAASARRFLRVPTIYVLSRNIKIISEFLSEIF